MNKTYNDELASTFRTARPVFMHMGLTSFFINLMLLALPLYSLQVLDRVLSTGSMQTLFWLTTIMVIIFLVASVLQAFRSFTLIKVGEWLDEQLSGSLLVCGLTRAAHTGVRGTQNLRDLGVIRGFLTGGGLLTLFDAPWSIISLIVIFLIHFDLGLITFLGCLALLGLAWFNEIAMHKPLDEANKINTKNFYQIDIAMRNAEAIEAMGMTDAITNFWQRQNKKTSGLQSLASNRTAIVQAVTRFLRLGLQIAITGWGAYLALHNQISSGSIIAASILAGRALAPFDAAISIWKSLVEARDSHRRLQKSLAKTPMRSTGIELPKPKGHILIDRLVYTIPSRPRPILNGVSLSLSPGEVLGIIGPSAAGKSSLAKLAVGIWKPQSGVVRLDGTDVHQWRRDQFGKYAGYLPQDVELFSGTVRDNIGRMDPLACDEDIITAAQLSCAHDMILSLPNGYDTDIGQGGAALSAGQRQRIGLARAYFGSPRFIVLDEPDASLDAEGERALGQAPKNSKLHAITTIIVTHRRSLFSYVDKLAVLQEGQLALYGPTQQVLAALLSHEKNAMQGTAQSSIRGPSSPPTAQKDRYAAA